MKKIFYLFIVLCLVLTGCASNSSDSQEVKDEKQDEEIIQEDEKEVSSNDKSYPAGTYKVGVDIPAGEYEVLSSRYIEISSDSTGETDSIIANHSGTTILTYISLNDGEYLKVSADTEFFDKDDCEIYPESDFPPATNFKSLLLGTYKVGKDLPAGEYKIQLIDGEDSGYWERNSAPMGASSDIIANDYFTDSSVYVTVQDGEYLTLSSGAEIVLSE